MLLAERPPTEGAVAGSYYRYTRYDAEAPWGWSRAYFGARNPDGRGAAGGALGPRARRFSMQLDLCDSTRGRIWQCGMRARATNRGRAAGTRCSMTCRVGRRAPSPYVQRCVNWRCEIFFLFRFRL